ncbi:MAG: sensor histidine kinase [Planctomycetia bacterium]
MKTSLSRIWSPTAAFTALGLWTGYYTFSWGGFVAFDNTPVTDLPLAIGGFAVQLLPMCAATGFIYPMIQRGLRSNRRWAGLGLTILAFLGVMLLSAIVTHLAWRPDDLQYNPPLFNLISYLFIHYALTLAACAAHASFVLRQEQKRALLEAELRALRAQLQPHFLFNTLHAIGVTARRDGETAAQMTALLGDMLRSSLTQREQPLVPLAEEHALLQPYLRLQQLRFADRLRIEQDLDRDTLNAQVPDLILQPLVENALQHGIERKPGAGSIKIRSRRHGNELVLEVSDDGAGLSTPPSELAQGTGLTSTRERLRGLFGAQASLDLQGNQQGGTTATVRVPYQESAYAA